MNAAETLEVIKMLHAVGASHFKSQDFEIQLKTGTPVEQIISPPIVPVQAQAQVQPNPAAEQKIKDLINTLNLPPEQLMDLVFPAGAGG